SNVDVSAHDGSVHGDSEGYDDDLEDYFEVDNGSSYYNSIDDEPVENDNAASIIEKLHEVTRKYYQEHASQENTKKPSEKIDEEPTEETNVEELDDKIKDYD
ncbi:8230_t:CDS:2, partial [Funneliformis caledonium]